MNEPSAQDLSTFDAERPLPELEATLGYTFRDITHLQRALTHRSFANETHGINTDNQRLELLGDAVLGLIITEYLFEHYPGYDEGALSKMKAHLVCEDTLAKLALRVALGHYIQLGRGESASGGRQRSSTLADAYEAVIAALYLDGGFERARAVVLELHQSMLQQVTSPLIDHDAKSRLQELVQDREGKRPEYKITEMSGPPHCRVFTAEVWLGTERVGTGSGRSKKEAQRTAAAEALQHLQARTDADKARATSD